MENRVIGLPSRRIGGFGGPEHEDWGNVGIAAPEVNAMPLDIVNGHAVYIAYFGGVLVVGVAAKDFIDGDPGFAHSGLDKVLRGNIGRYGLS